MSRSVFSPCESFSELLSHILILQLHVNQEWKQKLISEGYNVPSYDGIMIAEAATMDKVLEVSTGTPL